MQALELEPLKSGGDCFDDVVVTFDGWYRRGYELMYVEALRFAIDPASSESSTIGARIRTNLDNSLQLLQQYHGFAIQVLRNIPVQEGFRLIQEQLARGLPIGLNLDTYYSPWDSKFQISHYYTHVMIIAGIDSATHDLICVDPFFEWKNLRLSYSLFEQGFIGIMTIEPHDTEFLNRDVLIKDIQRKVQQQLDMSPLAIRALAEALPSIQFDAEYKPFPSFAESPLYSKLGMIVKGRYNFSKMLDCLESRYEMPQLRSLSDDMKRLAGKWNTVRGLMAKMYFSPQITADSKIMGSLTDRIVSNANAEETILRNLLEALDLNDKLATEIPPSLITPPTQTLTIQEIIHVELHDIFNNRAIENSDKTADFDGGGNYYMKQGIPVSNYMQVEEMTFAVTFLVDDRNDNVSCRGQIIPLREDRYNGLMVLGCSQFVNNIDNFTLEYTDGTTETVSIGFSDWWNPSPIYGEQIAWKASLARQQVGPVQNFVYLFANKSALTSGKMARSIILPLMPNIHVFGLSLWK